MGLLSRQLETNHLIFQHNRPHDPFGRKIYHRLFDANDQIVGIPDDASNSRDIAAMKIIVISLKHQLMRRELMSSALVAIDMKFEYFDAVDAKLQEHKSWPQYNPHLALRHFGAPLADAEIACFASHYSVWQRCVATGLPVCIMEDDLAFSPQFPTAFALAAEAIGRHDLIRLSGLRKEPHRTLEPLEPPYSLIRFLRGPVGAQCYCLSPKGAAALIAGANAWIEPADLYLDKFWQHGLASKAIYPFEVREIDRATLPSSIGARSQKRTGWRKLRREISRQKQALARLAYNLRHWPR
jgi:glycosyl transferase family 25